MFKRLLIFLVAFLIPAVAAAQVVYPGGGGSGGGGAAVSGQTVVNSGQGVMKNDASMIAGPVGAQLSNNTGTSLAAPSFTTDVSNAVVFNIYGSTNSNNSTPAADTQLINIAASVSNNMGVWAGYQVLASAGASGAQTIGFAAATGVGAVTIPFQPVSGQTIGISTSATRLQSAVAAGGTSITISVPSATALGDTLLACEAWYPSSPVAALPPSQPSPATGTQRWVNDGSWYGTATAGNGGIQCWHHQVTQAEPASYSFQTTGSGGVPAGFIADLTNVLNLDVPMTSATGTFAATNVGNDLCIQGADTSFFYQSVAGGSTAGQGCGQIGAFSSATKIYPNFGNLSGSTISSKQYAYGPDQGTAIQNAVNANPTGGEVILGTGIYMTCGGNNTSTCLSFAAKPAIMEGQGRGVSNWGFAGTGSFVPGTTINNLNLGTYIIVANTDLNQPAWQWAPGAGSVADNTISLSIRDLSMWGGVGTAGDGGGAAGMLASNFSWLSFDRVMMGNYFGDILDTTQTNSTTTYTDSTYFNQAWLMLSGSGDGWKSSFNLTYPGAQNEMAIDSQFDNNANSGIELIGLHIGITLWGTNVQRNDNFAKGGSRYEIYCNGCQAWGSIRGNYFENDSPTQNATLSNQTSGWTGTDWGANFAIGGINFSPVFSGSGATGLLACTTGVSTGSTENNSLGQCVSDAAACTNGTTYAAAGGAVRCRVQCNGTNWLETGMGC